MSKIILNEEDFIRQFGHLGLDYDDVMGFIQLLSNDVLIAVVKGELDLNDLARQELACRGLDLYGRWVGLEKAKKIYENGVE